MYTEEQIQEEVKEARRMVERSVHGLIGKLYRHQRGHSKERGHEMPTYTNDELRAWIIAKEEFKPMYMVWVASGYTRSLRPSIDRLRNAEGYSFGNIRLVTFLENMKAGNSTHIPVDTAERLKKQREAVENLKFFFLHFWNAKIAEAFDRLRRRPRPLDSTPPGTIAISYTATASFLIS